MAWIGFPERDHVAAEDGFEAGGEAEVFEDRDGHGLGLVGADGEAGSGGF